jgi:hypothetical protein
MMSAPTISPPLKQHTHAAKPYTFQVLKISKGGRGIINQETLASPLLRMAKQATSQASFSTSVNGR